MGVSRLTPSWLLALALFATPALAQDTPPEEEEDVPTEEDPLSPHRTRFDVLTDRAIGTASIPVEFNWRRTKVHVAGTGSFLFELNNFDSARVGGMVRLPLEQAGRRAGPVVRPRVGTPPAVACWR